MPKLNYQKAKQLGYSDDQILQYAKTRGVEVALPESPKQAKKERGLLDLLSTGTSIGGGVLGSALGPVGTVAGSAIGGGLGELLEQVISGDKTDLGAAGKEALWGGAGGAVGLGVGRLFGGGTRALANEATRGALVKHLPKTMKANQIDDLVKIATSKGAPMGSNVAKARKYATVGEGLRTERAGLVSEVGKEGSRRSILSELKKKALQKGLLDDKKRMDMKELNFFLKQFSPTAKTKPEQILAFKEYLNKFTGGAYKAVDVGNVSGLPSKAKAAYSLKESADEVISKYLPKNSRDSFTNLTQKMGKNINLENAYNSAAKTGVQVPVPFLGKVGLGPLSRPVEAGLDYAGRSSSAAGSSKLLQQTLGQAGARALKPSGGDTDEFAGYGVDGDIESGNFSQETPTGSKTNKTGDLLRQIALMDALSGGKNSTKLLAVAKAIDPPMSETRKGQISQMEGAEDLVDQLESAFIRASENGQTGFGVGPLMGILGKVSGGEIGQDAKVYNQLREGFTALIARATGEKGVLTDADAARALGLLASLNDNPESAARAFAGIRQVFGNARNRLSTQPGTEDVDISSLLESYQSDSL